MPWIDPVAGAREDYEWLSSGKPRKNGEASIEHDISYKPYKRVSGGEETTAAADFPCEEVSWEWTEFLCPIYKKRSWGQDFLTRNYPQALDAAAVNDHQKFQKINGWVAK